MKLSNILRRNSDAPSLRDRLDATKAKISQAKRRATLAARMGQNAFQALKPEPEPVDRIALVNYATWLFMERRLVCEELYPHMGGRGEDFVLGNCAADRFHFPSNPNGFPLTSRSPSKPTTRAVQVLDMVGVDWRSDLTESGRNHLDHPRMQDTGERPSMPHGWPTLDGALLTALVDLRRVDAAIAALIAHLPADRDTETLPGYDELQDARMAVLDILTDTRADSLLGIQAKAKTLLEDSLRGYPETIEALAHSIAKDLIGAKPSSMFPRPDPAIVVTEEGRRLLRAAQESFKLPDVGLDPHPDRVAAQDAAWAHFRGPVTSVVPTTARGCSTLARYVTEFQNFQGVDLGDEMLLILGNIARSPLL